MLELRKLEDMKEDASPSVPVVAAFLTSFLRDKRYSFGYGVCAVRVLGAAAHNDELALDSLKAAATIRPIRTEKEVYASREAMQQIGTLAVKHPEKRQELVPVLIWGLSEINPPLPLVDSLATISSGALGQIGPDAKAAIPKLKVLTAHPNEYVRKKAMQALDTIEE